MKMKRLFKFKKARKPVMSETFESPRNVIINCDNEFSIKDVDVKTGEYTLLVPPASARRFEFICKRGFELYTNGEFDVTIGLPRGEVLDSVSLTEVIPASELSVYDKMRQEMLGMISSIAERREHENFEDANDFEIEDDDQTILTPYEYEVMKEEMPIVEENLSNDEAPNASDNLPHHDDVTPDDKRVGAGVNTSEVPDNSSTIPTNS